MIYFTTFIFALLLAHIARAVPACGNISSPEEMYDPMYENEELVPGLTYKATWDKKYSQWDGDTKKGACPSLAQEFPLFKNFPDFPFIGGAKYFGPRCRACLKLTNKKTARFTYITAMDAPTTGFDFVISLYAFQELNDWVLVPSLEVEANVVPSHFCGPKPRS